jgi:cytochrome P450
MTLVSELELPGFDYTDPTLRGKRFHEAMLEVRARGWLASGPFGPIVLDREACEWWLRTRDATFPGMTIAEMFGVRDGPLYEQMKRNILHVNGPNHTRLRSLVNPALSAKAVERYRPALVEFLEGLFADACARGGPKESVGEGGVVAAGPAAGGHGGPGSEASVVSCDFVEAFAKPYPSQTIARVMGAPISDAPKLHHWSKVIQQQFDAAAMATEMDVIEEAVAEFYDYAAALVAARRGQPADDLISMLIAAEEEGDKLDDVECINLVFNILVGGVDTTQSQLAHAVRLLAEHPGQWKLLAQSPDLVDAAVEEALRVEPITPFTARIATSDIVYRDVTFPAGTILMVCAYTGNHDIESDAPDEFDITADRGKARALTFGAGIHYCLGANLARLELREALAFLAPRLKGLRLDGEPEYETIMGIYGLAKLPVCFSV